MTVLAAGHVTATEEAKYTVLLKEENFEVSAYQSHIYAETSVNCESLQNMILILRPHYGQDFQQEPTLQSLLRKLPNQATPAASLQRAF